MNFFEQQDRAQRNTKRLVFLLLLAVISLVAITTLLIATVFYFTETNTRNYLEYTGLWNGILHSLSWEMLAGITAIVCAVIFIGSIYKYFQLCSGGRAVAEAMGGHLINTQTGDADERKILNVVEEMAIASGTPVPPVYLLEDDGINAFAAGHTPQDAVIGITRGCIRLLKRDELQGVVAHEFSHIFYGDMKINMRLVALLNGILLIGLIGHFLVRSSGNSSSFRSKNKSSPVAMLGLGVGLIIVGYAGTFFGNLIKAAVSRQREFLADASAVKFTRNPEGISGALKKIGGYSSGSRLLSNNAAEFSHMYFSQGVSTAFNALMATHPPLEERIKRVEPRWDGNFPYVEAVVYENTQAASENMHIKEEGTSGFSSAYTSSINSTSENISNSSELNIAADPFEYVMDIDNVVDTIGQPGSVHLSYAQQVVDNIGEEVHAAAHNPWDAQALMFGLLLDKNLLNQEVQWQLLQQIFSAEQLQTLKPKALLAAALSPGLRLPLIELSIPTLKNLSLQQYNLFKRSLNVLVRADKNINLLEWSLCRVLTHNLEPQKAITNHMQLAQLVKETKVLLSAIAHAGAVTTAEAQVAYNSGETVLDLPATMILNNSEYTLMDLDLAVTRLNTIKPLQKPKLLKAMSECILHDKKITAQEAELFRAIADALDCPVPPLVATVEK